MNLQKKVFYVVVTKAQRHIITTGMYYHCRYFYHKQVVHSNRVGQPTYNTAKKSAVYLKVCIKHITSKHLTPDEP